jgi:hypothetical protein
MGSSNNIEEYLKDLKRRLKLAMPKIREEIKIYEQKMAEGKLTKNPIPGPQFNE